MRFCTPVFIGIGNNFNRAKNGVRTNSNLRVVINVMNVRTYARIPKSFIPDC